MKYVNLAHVARIEVVYPGGATEGIEPGMARLYMADGAEVKIDREALEAILGIIDTEAVPQLR
ncbi:MAG: hypothetical protein M3416_03850 [Acidobacteriota bacterium]|nr:hypothetical protein [Acidobacteriota bacterium]